jgi:sulfur-oxidizing protein SoxA
MRLAGLLVCFAATLAIVGSESKSSASSHVDPVADRKALRDFYATKFADVPLEAHKDGVYAIDSGAREQWQELEEFPLYEIAVDEGAELYDVAFANGESYADCFGDGAVKQNYPHFDEASAIVVTLEADVNRCRTEHGEVPLEYAGLEMAAIVSHMAYQSRGGKVDVATPTSVAALAAYEDGKRFYLSRRGQLNFACSHCHVQIVGNLLRADRLSASLGHVTHWPVYRLKWQEMGVLHKRFQECNSQVGAEPLAMQSDTYRNLEYFLSYLSNGLELNGPATRR